MMRLSPRALALAFGTAKVITGLFTYTATIFTMWSVDGIKYGMLPPSRFSLQFVVVQLLIFGFLGGAIAGALAVVVYNKIILKSPSVT